MSADCVEGMLLCLPQEAMIASGSSSSEGIEEALSTLNIPTLYDRIKFNYQHVNVASEALIMQFKVRIILGSIQSCNMLFLQLSLLLSILRMLFISTVGIQSAFQRGTKKEFDQGHTNDATYKRDTTIRAPKACTAHNLVDIHSANDIASISIAYLRKNSAVCANMLRSKSVPSSFPKAWGADS